MATRMQQRRGTAAQWTAANPVLAAGEIGFETDTNKFKMGNGSSAWTALQYFANAAELTAIIDGAPDLLNTLNELAAAIGDDPAFFTNVGNSIADNIDSHNVAMNVHGIANTALLATLTNVSTAQTAAETFATTAVTNHSNDTNGVHGIDDTAALARTTEVTSAINLAVGTHASDTQDVHGISDTSDLVYTSDLSDHNLETVNVHGIDDTADLATKTYADTAVSTHAALTEDVHGIADVSLLATQDYVDTAVGNSTVNQAALAGVGIDYNTGTDQFDIDATVATKQYADDSVSTHNDDTSNVHGITDTAALATKSYADTAEADAITAAGTAADTKIATAVAALTKSSVGLGNVDNTSDADKPVSTATQTALDAKASLAGATFTGNVEMDGNLVVDGNFTVNGTNFSASATSITIEDNLVQLAHQNAANTVDLGLVVAYNDGTAKHAGIARDVSDNKWKLFKGVSTEPSTTVAFGEGSLDDLAVGALEATTVIPSSGVVFSDGTQTKEGVVSRTPIIAKTDSYTLSALTERDSLIEVAK
jgi:hypothetical protein